MKFYKVGKKSIIFYTYLRYTTRYNTLHSEKYVMQTTKLIDREE